MGYAHSLSRPLRLDADLFSQWSADCRWIVAYARTLGVKLAGPDGSGRPVTSMTQVLFNGRERCRHQRAQRLDPAANRPRWCGGRCAHDSFTVELEYDPYSLWERSRDGSFLDRFTTAHKPYDVAVTACLLMLSHRFGPTISVTSDGGASQWHDGRHLALLACGVFPPLPGSLRRASAA